MDPLTVIALLNAIAELTPKVYAMVAAAKVTMNATDAASVEAALAAAQIAAQGDIATALADLDEAAKL